MRWDVDEFDALMEIVDALCDCLQRNPNVRSGAVVSIAERARRLRLKTLGETDGDNNVDA